MKKPGDVDEARRYTQTAGDKYTADAPPPWWPDKDCHWSKTIFGDWFQRHKDTPYCCDPSSERYWCM